MAGVKILSTKTLGAGLARLAAQSGVALLERDFIATGPVQSPEVHRRVRHWLERPATVVFTSVNAVEAVAHFAREGAGTNWRAYCIADKTSAALTRLLPAAALVDKAPYGGELAQKIIAGGERQVVFFCGSRRRDELPTLLTAQGIGVEEVCVYQTLETPQRVEGAVDGVLFFSPSGVESFFSANSLAAHTVCFAIGRTTAEALRAHSANKIVTCDVPSQESLLDAALRYFHH